MNVFQTVGLIISILGAVLGVISFSRTARQVDRKEVQDQEHRLTALEVKVDVFWKGIALDAAALLHRPHPEFKRRDELLETFTYKKLNSKEARELYNMLVPVWEDIQAPYAERLAASILMRTLSHEYGFGEERED